ncbi:hypothetical protein CLV78_10692 [Aliiruegeria haliotis]|uniref:Cytochrome c domain-containing protein n=1 Tax=Aliiruegeria haliotis TaxID=1280846 RepID=A0A2T0RN51_9RHOB|nr:hypothetical protein [Aliiruegeria haliotis]PRY22552.1 hypothetical protein CLV78_10692 [Aliiruegeria haliotis]
MRFTTGVAIAAASFLVLPQTAPASPTTQEQMMYFRAYVQDDPACLPTAAAGVVDWNGIATPAATCPDAFAWVSLLTSIRNEFWNDARDETVWPASPLPLCATPGDSDCCDPSVLDQSTPIAGAPPAGCPYAPGDWTDPPTLKITPTNRHAPAFVDELDPGRALRDEEGEQVYRNAPMLRYIFEHNLYTKEGLGARFVAMNEALSKDVPFHRTDLSVRFPEDAVMVKVDWVHQRFMIDAKLIDPDLDPPQNPDTPYITVEMEGADPVDSGLYYLVAMTNASKVLPGWHWYAIEHVANAGRCDFIGCNDSFGYAARGIEVDGALHGTNYVPPFPLSEPENGAATDIPSGYGKVYSADLTGETLTDALAGLYDGLGIGTAATDADPAVLDPADPAWRNYRLKGTQTSFTTNDGVTTLMGASVTEGGFVNSASCMTCHSQASVNAAGNPGVAGVGSISRLNIFGYQQSASGAPDEAWFYSHGGAVYDAFPVDFVWGILNAKCSAPADDTGELCKSYDGIVLTFGAD